MVLVNYLQYKKTYKSTAQHASKLIIVRLPLEWECYMWRWIDSYDNTVKWYYTAVQGLNVWLNVYLKLYEKSILDVAHASTTSQMYHSVIPHYHHNQHRKSYQHCVLSFSLWCLCFFLFFSTSVYFSKRSLHILTLMDLLLMRRLI